MATSVMHRGWKWSVADASNPTLVMVADQTSRAIHLATPDIADTDWNVGTATHPTLYIHSHTTPATDYISFAHDGTTATINIAGATYFTITGGDLVVANGYGLIVGNTTQITANSVAELQVLGTALADSSAIIGAFSADAVGPELNFVKGRAATIGGLTIVQDNDVIGKIVWLPADGADLATEAAVFQAEVDDGSPAAGDVGMAFVWRAMPGGAGAIADVLRLSAAGDLTPGVSDQGSLGTGALMWGDLFLASAGVIDFNNGNVTLTHSAGVLAIDGSAGANVTITDATLAATGRILKLSATLAAAALTDGYGAFEVDVTLSGSPTDHSAAASAWVNITGGTVPVGTYICARNDGIYEATAATITNAKLIFGARMHKLFDDTDALSFPFSLNTNNTAITALFDCQNRSDFGLVGAAGTAENQLLPILRDAAGNIRYVMLYTN